MNILTVNELSKNYGAVKALDNVSFSVGQGKVFGILGPNGSGKTTLLGIIMDILKANSGSYLLFDQEPTETQRRQIGTLLETPNFYHYLNAVDNLKIAAAIKKRGAHDIESVLHTTGLYEKRKFPFSSFSLGMKQRLAIASALLGNPDVLVFDEPTNGLDPAGIADIRQLIIKLASSGKTIIMASHMLDEVEKVCTDVAILKFGKLITSGRVEDILVSDELVELSSAQYESLLSVVHQIPNCKKVEQKDQQVVLLTFTKGQADAAAINRLCFEQGITLSHLIIKKQSLESKFLELTN
jgi:ABC-2 type transport system ATP-binding protein